MVAIRENEDGTKIQINDKRNEATERKAQRRKRKRNRKKKRKQEKATKQVRNSPVHHLMYLHIFQVQPGL